MSLFGSEVPTKNMHIKGDPLSTNLEASNGESDWISMVAGSGAKSTATTIHAGQFLPV